jgi:hypothetical protein
MASWPKARELKSHYGDPDAGHDGLPDRMWEVENLERFAPPYGMVLAWDKTKKLNSITCHKKCASSLLKVLENIQDHYGTQEKIEEARMHLFGGAYNFRLMRGSTKLSMHSYGCAIDLDPEANPMGLQYRESSGMMRGAVVKIFEAEGWRWGGLWKRPDAMHFEAVS